jgi:HEAT repeat protein
LLSSLASVGRAQTSAGREAAAAKIADALATRNIDQALGAYDAYTDAAKRPDIELLRPIAREQLERVAQAGDPQAATAAAERLAKLGDTGTLNSLRKTAGDPSAANAALSAQIGLAKAGDTNAIAALATRLNSSTPEAKVQAIQVLQNANAKAQAPAVAALLDDPAPSVRMSAASAVAALQYREAIPKLKAMYETDSPAVKMMVGVALTRLGDPTAEAAVNQLLNSQVPEMRLMAGQALQSSKSPQWISVVKELRNDPNPLNQIRSAEIVACCDQAWSKGVLAEALANPSVLVRMEAARALEATGLADARLARKMLGDIADIIRVYGAGSVLTVTATPAPRPSR